MSYVLTVTTYKKGEFKMPNIDIDNYVEKDRWDYSNECNKWEGGGLRNNYEPEQNRMVENYTKPMAHIDVNEKDIN